jgi:hypothetical protein
MSMILNLLVLIPELDYFINLLMLYLSTLSIAQTVFHSMTIPLEIKTFESCGKSNHDQI